MRELMSRSDLTERLAETIYEVEHGMRQCSRHLRLLLEESHQALTAKISDAREKGANGVRNRRHRD